MKKILGLFLLAGMAATAQQNLNIQQATYGQYQDFAVKSLTAPQWRPDTHTLTYLDATYQNLVARSEDGQWAEKVLVTKAELQKALNEVLGEKINLSTFPTDYTWKDKSTIQFNVDGEKAATAVLYDVDKKAVTSELSFLDGGQHFISPKGTDLVYTKDNNIKLVQKFATAGGGLSINQKPITDDTDKGIVNGSDYVHRQEFGIDRGMWWSPDSNSLLYYRKDETMVADYPLVQWGERIAADKEIKYPMAGMKSEEVTLVVYNIASGAKVTLKTEGDKEQYLTSVTWSPDSKFVFVGVLNRGQNHLWLNKYDAATGNLVKTLFEETATTYVEPLHGLTFIPGKNSEFLYRSEKDGYEQFYHYNTDGKLIKNLGFKDVVVTEFLGFDKDAKNFFYIGTANNGLDRQLYKTELKSGKTVQVTTGSGTHDAIVSTDGTLYLDSFSNTITPNDVNIISVKNGKATNLFKAENPYTGKTVLPKMELVTLTAADGKTPLNGRIIYPANFDATKKYPVMVYVYGGPHAQLVTNKWLGGGGLFDYYMAQKGYVVFTLDNRGSDARGRDFEHVIHRNLGVNEMADQMKGVEFLKSKGFVDAGRIGVYGWSFGGFMASSLMLDQADTFKVGVAGGPVCDWQYYEIMYGERYMDTPQENPEGYKGNNIIDKAKKLKGHLLVIHGAQDNVVVQQHSMQFIQACIQAGKQVDYFLYPTHEHNVRGRDRYHLNQKIADYFDTYLKP